MWVCIFESVSLKQIFIQEITVQWIPITHVIRVSQVNQTHLHCFPCQINTLINKEDTTKVTALAEWLSWLKHHSIQQKVAGSNPGQGPYLGCGFDPQLGHIQEATDWCFSLTSMFLSLSTPLSPHFSLYKISECILRWGLKIFFKKQVTVVSSFYFTCK